MVFDVRQVRSNRVVSHSGPHGSRTEFAVLQSVGRRRSPWHVAAFRLFVLGLVASGVAMPSDAGEQANQSSPSKASAVPAPGSGHFSEASVLEGLKRVRVSVVVHERLAHVLDAKTVQDSVEKELRSAGLEVVPHDGTFNPVGLCLNISGFEFRSIPGQFVHDTDIFLADTVQLLRGGKRVVGAITWTGSQGDVKSFGASAGEERVSEVLWRNIGIQVKQFLGDWRKANGQGKGAG